MTRHNTQSVKHSHAYTQVDKLVALICLVISFILMFISIMFTTEGVLGAFIAIGNITHVSYRMYRYQYITN